MTIPAATGWHQPSSPVMQPAVPPEAPLEMPVQDFRAPPPPGPAFQPPSRRVMLARLIAFGGTALIGAVGFWQMLLVFGSEIQPLQYALLALFTLTFTWVGFSFCSMLAGLLAEQPRDAEEPAAGRIAVLMPVYHEDVGTSLGLLAALADDLEAEGIADRTEIFILSDSRDPDFFAAETIGVSRLRDLSRVPVWYRRRDDNAGRKSGNVAEFVGRWGGRYEQMVVLDADSIVTGAVVRQMSARMAADPAVGLIQTVPMLVGGQTLFARVVQFAGRIYGPAVARGVAAWSGDNGNYWGHNAMMRVPAFAACCGLPELPGKPPFGGTILSHDFVEAALMRRAGWKVRLDWDLRASYEGCPPTLLDMAVRERRWAQGNLQHARILGARRFTATSRVHFVVGILGFLMSPIWLGMILTGLALTATVLLSKPEYFPATYQLFPDWPTFDPTRMKWLFAATMAFLLLPKALSVHRAWRRPVTAGAGGKTRLLSSAMVEIILSALIAPVQMLIQTQQIFDILRGRNSGWESQVRRATMPPWGLVWRRHVVHVIAGIATLLLVAWLAPGQLIWLSPILAGLILAPLISRYTASPALGRIGRRAGLLATPEERMTPPIIAAAAAHSRRLRPAPDLLSELGRDPSLRARHAALTSAPAEGLPVRERLSHISAAAKIAAASTQDEARSFLDSDETAALLSDRTLLEQWAGLPQ